MTKALGVRILREEGRRKPQLLGRREADAGSPTYLLGPGEGELEADSWTLGQEEAGDLGS